jgi:5-formyltetrahydrofolate cyclo-ligase
VVKSDKVTKEQIRKHILAALRRQNSAQRSAESDQIKRRLFKEKCFKQAVSVMFYVSKPYEVDTSVMIEEALKLGKKVIVPVTNIKEKKLIPSEIRYPEKELAKGPFGILEPKKKYIKTVMPNEIDMVIVPGIAFDRKGNRIGHGQGYFDRFLKYLPKRTPTIGLAFKLQLVRRIKAFPWDIPVTKIITA